MDYSKMTIDDLEQEQERLIDLLCDSDNEQQIDELAERIDAIYDEIALRNLQSED